jgi:hypothetical protein
MLHIIPLSSFCPLKIDVALKITIQNSRVIYQKFNGDFKSHINFGGTKKGQGDVV